MGLGIYPQLPVARGATISRGSLLSFLLAATVIAAVPELAQASEFRPIDSGAPFAIGDSLNAQSVDYCGPGKRRALLLSGGGVKG